MTPLEIRALRHCRKLPQKDFARAIGVSRTTLVALEQGRAQPSRVLLMALAAYVEGLSPYRANPTDTRCFLASQRKRVNREAFQPDLPFHETPRLSAGRGR